MIENYELKQLVSPLQDWFTKHHRILPWRENPQPYAVWISEIMLQQTRVEAVKPYFDRFMETLPDVKSLAECEEDRYLKLWEGLGYYNRVRNLHIAAIQIMEQYNGEIPGEYEKLIQLKGIGSYTAGAISSIAFGNPVPAVDGNVLRVISRVCMDDSDIMSAAVKKNMEKHLRNLMEDETAGVEPARFNQALMELGAIVCVPNGRPHCTKCPWEKLCLAHKNGCEETLPVKKKALKRRIEEKTVLVIRQDDKTVLHKRENKGLLAGLYEIPNLEGYKSADEVLDYIKKQGYSPIRIQPIEQAKHIFSHVEWHMQGYFITVEESDFSNENTNRKDWLFVDSMDAMTRYAIPSAFAKYAKYLNIPLGKDKWLKKPL